jgi:hypothetical protein
MEAPRSDDAGDDDGWTGDSCEWTGAEGEDTEDNAVDEDRGSALAQEREDHPPTRTMAARRNNPIRASTSDCDENDDIDVEYEDGVRVLEGDVIQRENTANARGRGAEGAGHKRRRTGKKRKSVTSESGRYGKRCQTEERGKRDTATGQSGYR